MTETNWVALTEEKTWDRFEKAQERSIRNEGHGAIPVALELTKDCLPLLSSFIEDQLKDTQSTVRSLKLRGGAAEVRTLLTTLRKLPVETIALCALNAMLHGVGKGDDLRAVSINLGGNIAGELWAAKLLRADDKLAARIERAVRKRHAGLKQRETAARAMAAKAGYTSRKWSKEATLRAGGLLANWVFQALPHVFYTVEANRLRVYPAVQEAALEVAMDAVKQAVFSRPTALPCVQPPLPWTSLNSGGYPDERIKGRLALLRRDSKIQHAEARAAIRNGTMQPVMDAINSLQAVAWTINQPVLDVMKHCIEHSIPVKGLPRPKPYPKPAHPKPWEEMTNDEQRAWKHRANKIEEQNRGLVADRVLLAGDTSTAELLSLEERFYTPFNSDWRGRVYPLPHFNFQRDDRVRALFLFADGAPIGEEGLYWLKVHVANCGDFDKISKRPLDERVQWVNDNLEGHGMIYNVVATPEHHLEWTKADKPFLFLAACKELVDALAVGPSYVTRLPVSFDGSCSGLQHLCAMTRAPEGSLVNLTPSPVPQDVYTTVADVVCTRISADANSATVDPKVSSLASRCLSFGIDRKVVKRAVMTFAYSSKRFGMSKQFQEDLMRPLEIKVLAGELEEHPFGDDNGRAACSYLAGHVFTAIKEIVSLPADAMNFLQGIARAMAHEGKAARWTTPAGLPVVNAYYEPVTVRVRLWLHDASVTMRLITGDTKEIDKDRAANGIAPNFVHSMDAAHLMLTVNASVREDITQIATVHDSFGCLAPQATRFNAIIREQLATMYVEHNVLAEVLEQAKCDLTQHNWHRLPVAPQLGTLNITEVLNAPFAFA